MNRILNNSNVQKGFLLLLLLTLVFYLLLQWNWGSVALVGSRSGRSMDSDCPCTPTSNATDFDGYVLDYIRTHHLIQHDPGLPTNYSGGEERHPMASFIAKHLNSERDGFFIECGANDGVFLSNTVHLERAFGWTGLLVEADPFLFRQLKTRNRHAWTSNTCLSPTPYPIKVDMVSHYEKKGWPQGVSTIKFDPRVVRGKEWNTTFSVQCFPLSMLLAAINRTEIDYLSLDVEGMELHILKTIPFDKLRIKLISAESDYPGMNHKVEIKKFLEPLGYKRIKEFTGDVPLRDDLYELQEDPQLSPS